MRIIELILVMLMFANTLDALIEDKEVQIQKEKSFGINMQRKLQDKYKEKWESIGQETGKNNLLWMIGEIEAVIFGKV